MRRPRGRTLSGDETRLWGEVAKLITPLRGRAVPTPPEPPAAEPAPKPRSIRPAANAPAMPLPNGAALKRPLKLADLGPAPQQPAKTQPAKTQPLQRPSPPLAPGLQRKERRALQRGTLAIEARIDLHGLFQAEAYAALIGFIVRSRAAGHARVLVVTGKGGMEEHAMLSERGVLRRSVPHWLRGPDLRGLVLGFEEAGRQHGGSGALYVRLKRR